MITHYIRPSKATSRSIGTPCLSRRFRLNTKDDGEAFLQDMLKISREENVSSTLCIGVNNTVSSL